MTLTALSGTTLHIKLKDAILVGFEADYFTAISVQGLSTRLSSSPLLTMVQVVQSLDQLCS